MQLSGINIFAVYARSIAFKLYPALIMVFPISIQLTRFGGALLSSFLLKNIGRKTILIFGLITEVVLGASLWGGLHYGYEKSIISGLIILILIFLIVMTYAFAISTVGWLYIPEVIQPSLVL